MWGHLRHARCAYDVVSFLFRLTQLTKLVIQTKEKRPEIAPRARVGDTVNNMAVEGSFQIEMRSFTRRLATAGFDRKSVVGLKVRQAGLLVGRVILSVLLGLISVARLHKNSYMP